MNERDAEMARRRLKRMGGTYDAERRVWSVPSSKRRALARLLRDLGAVPRRGGELLAKDDGDE